MSKTNYCVTPECDEEISPRSKLEHCQNCRASMGMWRRRGIKAIMVRRSKLKKYDSRMERLVGPKSIETSGRKRAS
jgi:hypothetical protein